MKINKQKIKEQLKLRENKLFCIHNSEDACEDCLKNITGNVSGITGNMSDIRGNVSGIRGDVSGITGNMSGITGNMSDIIKVLKELINNGKIKRK